MLIIFDVDGTLLGGESHDWSAFDRALHQTFGFVHVPGFFDRLEDVTAESVVHAAAESCGIEPCIDLKAQVRQAYLDNLKQAHASHPNAFPQRIGASQLLEELAALPGIDLAIATGDWHPTISFKLSCAGIDLTQYTFATASDAPRRTEIIQTAAHRSGRSLADAIYVGDGPWDLRACKQLGIPFIGTGERIERLRKAGADHFCEVFTSELFLQTARRAAL